MLTTLDGLNLVTSAPAALERLHEKVGQKIRLTVKREGKDVALEMTVGAKDETTYELTEMPQASPEQLRVREAWLKTGRRAASETSTAHAFARRAA
jgi:predicted metalloprotease with PDZ domain